MSFAFPDGRVNIKENLEIEALEIRFKEKKVQEAFPILKLDEQRKGIQAMLAQLQRINNEVTTISKSM
jgi:hypothetical protein